MMKHRLTSVAVLLLNLPLWLLYGLVSVVLGLIGIPLVSLAALGRQWELQESRVWPGRMIRRWWHLARWMNAIYGNEQDGIDGVPQNSQPSNAEWPDRKFRDLVARVIAWSAFRNATNNLRFLHHFAPWLKWVNPNTIYPERVDWCSLGDRAVVCWMGPYAGLRVTMFGRQLWIGWKINPGMAYPEWWPGDPCWKGIGFTAGQVRKIQ